MLHSDVYKSPYFIDIYTGSAEHKEEMDVTLEPSDDQKSSKDDREEVKSTPSDTPTMERDVDVGIGS